MIRFDGASRGNPGKAACAAVLYDGRGNIERHVYCTLEKSTTCNVAEYTALIAGLRLAHSMGVQKLIVEGDSKLVIEQVFGKWECRHPRLHGLYQTARRLVSLFDVVIGRWIPREQNGDADGLCNRALDTMTTEGSIELFAVDENLPQMPKPLPIKPSVFLKACEHRKRPYSRKTAPSILEQLGASR